MKTGARIAVLPVTALLLVGCGADRSNDEGPTSSSAENSATSSTSTNSTSTSTTVAEEPARTEPHLVECIYGGGSWTGNGEFSDGSYGPHPDCQAKRDAQLTQNPYRCPQTDWHVPDPSWCTDPSKGGRANAPAPAPASAPVPEQPVYDTSGEAQTHYGCQEGYINDPALCGEMEQKYG